ncbi:MAG: DEAD/DEAH box helicase family protein [Gemmataceae bacterium]
MATGNSPSIILRFVSGTLALSIPNKLAAEEIARQFPELRLDPQDGIHRLPANRYRPLVEWLVGGKVPHVDEARGYNRRPFVFQEGKTPFDHQTAAVDGWWKSGGRGVVVLPTGTGKSFVAQLAIHRTGRPTMVICPTIDLMHQWQGQLSKAFGEEVGLAGGGFLEWRDITVATYDSAYLQVERWGNRFGLLVFNEVHHLPGASTQLSAKGAIAPFRLGLTATLEREDGGHAVLDDLIGPVVYRRDISELSGTHLAEYQTERVWVELSPQEREQYDNESLLLREYLASQGYSLGGAGGWNRFLRECSRSPEARRAFKAFLVQRRLLQQCEAKMEALERLLQTHHRDRVLLFTADNATVYKISRRFLVPALTHLTKPAERKSLLQAFHDGTLPILATSRVLNEGVDVPKASVAVVLSGSGTVREHVQRLGRILRRHEGKKAVLYEVVVRGTKEEFVSNRRRRHDAYQ